MNFNIYFKKNAFRPGTVKNVINNCQLLILFDGRNEEKHLYFFKFFF